MPTPPAKFVWYELMTTDLDAASAFYGSVVGWTSERWSGEHVQYIMAKAGDRPVAGLMTIPQEAEAAGLRPAWVGYIYADDVDAATERVAKAGGRVHRTPTDIPDIGRFSVLADPQGAMFMLFTPEGTAAPTLPPMTPGDIGWRELYASDWTAAFDFYSSQFGWTKVDEMDMGGELGTYLLFATGGSDAVGGMMTKPAEVPHPAWLYYFNVAGIDAAVERVKANDGQVLNGPMEVPGGAFIVQCRDPQGAMFALVGPRG